MAGTQMKRVSMSKAPAASRHVVLVCLLAVLGLTACERKKPVEEPPAGAATTVSAEIALPSTPVEVKLKGQGCGDRCAEFEADWLGFPGQPALDAALLGLIDAPAGNADVAGVIRQMGQRFMTEAAEAGEPWQQDIEAELKTGVGQVSVIQVTVYTFTGGAHGMTSITPVNWDRQLGRQLALTDIILPGRADAFWAEARKAHQAWAHSRDNSGALAAGWPFATTALFALRKDGLELQYQPYEIGPYSEGAPDIRIDYARLRDVLKPEYLPAR